MHSAEGDGVTGGFGGGGVGGLVGAVLGEGNCLIFNFFDFV